MTFAMEEKEEKEVMVAAAGIIPMGTGCNPTLKFKLRKLIMNNDELSRMDLRKSCTTFKKRRHHFNLGCRGCKTFKR